MEKSLFSRDLLSLIGKGEDAPPPPPEQRRDEMEEDEVNLNLVLSLGFRIVKKVDKLPRSSSAAALTTPAEVPAPPALPRTSSVPVQAGEHAPRLPASESPSSASLESDRQRLLGTLMSTSSLHAVIEAAGNDEYKKRKEEQSLKRLEVKKKMIERRNSTCSTSKEAAGGQVPEEMNAHTGKLVIRDEAVVGNNENHSSGMNLAKRRRGRPPKYQATLTSQHSLSAAGKKPNLAFKGAAVTMEPSSSSSVPSSSKAIRSVTAASPLPPSSVGPRTAAETLGSSSRGDQSIYLGRAAAVRANSTGEDVGRRLMQEMPAVYTKDLRSGNRVNGFLYKYMKAEVKIVCICHGSFFTPSEFVEHAGAGNGEIDNPLRHIVVSPTPTL